MKKAEIDVTLEGLSDIMFDRFFDHSKEQRPPEQKLYMVGDNEVVLPASNLEAFLYNQKGHSAVSTVEKKKRGEFIQSGVGHTIFTPQAIPFLDEKGKVIKWNGFDDKGKMYVHKWGAPTTKATSGGNIIKQEIKIRPVLRLPWRLKFHITLIENPLVTTAKLNTYFEIGGVLVGLGTWRPTFGRFIVKEWAVKGNWK